MTFTPAGVRVAVILFLLSSGCVAASVESRTPATFREGTRVLGAVAVIEPVGGLPTPGLRVTNRSDAPVILTGEVLLSAGEDCDYAEEESSAIADDTGTCFATMALLSPGEDVLMVGHIPLGDSAEVPASGTCLSYWICLQSITQPVAVNYRGLLRF